PNENAYLMPTQIVLILNNYLKNNFANLRKAFFVLQLCEKISPDGWVSRFLETCFIPKVSVIWSAF
ncbi:MAG: hypothetical protein AABY42_07290, partial [Nitrospirota bacterium]